MTSTTDPASKIKRKSRHSRNVPGQIFGASLQEVAKRQVALLANWGEAVGAVARRASWRGARRRFEPRVSLRAGMLPVCSSAGAIP